MTMMPSTKHDDAVTHADDLRTIRALCERVLRANPDDTEVDLVRRMTWLAMPEGAGKAWFARWQVSSQMNDRLRVVLGDLLTRLDRGEEPPEDVRSEAWAVLSDVQTLMPEPRSNDPIEDGPHA